MLMSDCMSNATLSSRPANEQQAFLYAAIALSSMGRNVSISLSNLIVELVSFGMTSSCYLILLADFAFSACRSVLRIRYPCFFCSRVSRATSAEMQNVVLNPHGQQSKRGLVYRAFDGIVWLCPHVCCGRRSLCIRCTMAVH